MEVCASRIFDFLDQHQTCVVERREVALKGFSVLRRNLRFILTSLHEGDDHEQHDVSDRLRMLLSEWLTVPIQFDATILSSIQTILGSSETIGSKWGNNIRSAYDEAIKAARALVLTDNPVRVDLQTVIREVTNQGRTFRIYCHRRARPHFESLAEPGDSPLNDGTFLHSVTDYRQAEPFDVLIKVGPLRSRGWGSAPDALLTAPRFATLIQIVWSGCGDEPNFGYDPVSGASDAGITAENGMDRNDLGHGISWTRRVTSVGDDIAAIPDHFSDIDEFQIFGQLKQASNSRRATLVQIDNQHGILYPPYSQVLSFDPNSNVNKPIDRRLLGETLFEGMFIVRPLLADISLGGLQAEHGHFSQIWKSRMAEEWGKDPEALTRRLRGAGLDLLHLETAIGHWCEPPTTVIHAPQRRKHFEILIGVLGVDSGSNVVSGAHTASWWQYAWNEIRRSRGEAIQAGFQGHDIIEEQLLVILNDMLPEIRLKAAAGDGMSLSIPSLSGAALFNKISSIEAGFIVPETELKVVRELNTIEQWRV